MLEFQDIGGTSWLLKKRVSYCIDSEEVSSKRKIQELLANDDEKASSSDRQRKRLREDSTNMNNEIKEYGNNNHMRLDLELNLSPPLIDLNRDHDDKDARKKKCLLLGKQTHKNMAWVAFDDLDDDKGGGGGSGGQDEMVARVCMKCHMLVMLCKASPACPNCKFMHSHEDTSTSLLFTPKSTLLA
ncbi:unnamed protein product [Cochlearia groenlandica]